MVETTLRSLAKRHGWPAGVLDEVLAAVRPRRGALAEVLASVPPVALDDAATYAIDLPTDEEPTGESSFLDRYQDLGPIGSGGMAEVRRVLDRQLNRVMAMKIIAVRLRDATAARTRFVEEAQATAQLEHPGIVPVHDIGLLPDGRLYFTMKEVRGRTLADVIREVHFGGGTPTSLTPWNPRGLVATFSKVCEAVAYAHARGVIHRDLKPDNVMVGEYGEALVMDWGLARVLGRAAMPTAETPVVTTRSESSASATRAGAVAGTPRYMSPEQASGSFARLTPAADVYSLGAVLYTALCGAPPVDGFDVDDVIARVAAGRVVPLADRKAGGLANDPELAAICSRAMAFPIDERYPSARELAADVIGWLDGAMRRERAMRVVADASAQRAEASGLVAQADAKEAIAASLLADVAAWEPEERKAPGWAQQDAALALRHQAFQKELEHEGLLHAALTHAPDLVEAHAGLAALYRRAHGEAERLRDTATMLRSEAKMRVYAEALPAAHPDRLRHEAYLAGTGALSLVTDPPARADLYVFRPHNRRLVPVFERTLGQTPIRGVALPMGSYLVVLGTPGRRLVRYPIHIGREEHWDGVPPGASRPLPIRLPDEDELAADDIYAPAGWFGSGAAIGEASGLPVRRLWCDAIVAKRHLVTSAEYVAFLDDLVANGREEDAVRWAPRERSANPLEAGAQIFGRRPDGGFAIVPDADGDTWDPTWPVFMVDWFGARAYAQWWSERTGRPWRLPGELEWEKVARGVDFRIRPWGDFLDASWCCMRDSHRGRPLPASVDSFPVDESVYGVRGVAGNMRQWCADAYLRDGPAVAGGLVHAPADDDVVPALVNERGGNWVGDANFCRLARRYGLAPGSRDASLGFRLVRSYG